MSIEELKIKFDSSRWQRFLANFFNESAYMMWHDGYDEDAILNLNDEEKQVAEEMLLLSIPKNGMWSAAGLALLQSQKGLSIMKEELTRTNINIIRIRLADAITQITQSNEFLPVLIDCLQNAVDSGDRLEAARDLRKFPTPDIIQALYKAVADKDYLVRAHACDSLLAIHRFEEEIDEFPDIFENIREDHKKKNYIIAQQQLRELFQKRG